MSSLGHIHKDQEPPPGAVVSEQILLLKHLPEVCWAHPGAHTPCPHPCPHSCPNPAAPHQLPEGREMVMGVLQNTKILDWSINQGLSPASPGWSGKN